jgi:uncharacterized protein
MATISLLIASIIGLSDASKTSFSFQSQGEKIACDLYLPQQMRNPIPATVAGPGLANVKENFFPPYAEALTSVGIASLIFDYPGFGESTGKTRQDVIIEQQLQVYRDGINTLAKDSRFDAKRIGLWGKSLSGAHVLNLAATEARAKAAVAIVPHIGLNGDSAESRAELIEAIGADIIAKAKGRDRVMVPVIGSPGTRAVMTTDGAQDSLETKYNGTNYRNEITASSLLAVAEYDVSKQAKSIKIPTLVLAAETDNITPLKAIHQALDDVQSVQVKEFPGMHFNFSKIMERSVMELTVNWFQKNL